MCGDCTRCEIRDKGRCLRRQLKGRKRLAPQIPPPHAVAHELNLGATKEEKAKREQREQRARTEVRVEEGKTQMIVQLDHSLTPNVQHGPHNRQWHSPVCKGGLDHAHVSRDFLHARKVGDNRQRHKAFLVHLAPQVRVAEQVVLAEIKFNLQRTTERENRAMRTKKIYRG